MFPSNGLGLRPSHSDLLQDPRTYFLGDVLTPELKSPDTIPSWWGPRVPEAIDDTTWDVNPGLTDHDEQLADRVRESLTTYHMSSQGVADALLKQEKKEDDEEALPVSELLDERPPSFLASVPVSTYFRVIVCILIFVVLIIVKMKS